ncbi:PAS/PAC sensor signal transduction histidine kinase [gamma proteobacterium HdN1]|nr:PAS/PAC sensor signal transduction histidine kinase [gamma proteobacterium HdN1]
MANASLRLQPQDFSHIDRSMALSFGLLITSLMLVALVAASGYLRTAMDREQSRLATLTTEVLADALSRVSFAGKYQARLLIEKLQKDEDDIAYIRLIDTHGVIIASSTSSENGLPASNQELEHIKPLLSESTTIRVRKLSIANLGIVREIGVMYYGGFNNQTQGVLLVGISESSIEKSLYHGLLYTAFLLFFLAFIGIIVTLRMSRHFAAPTRELAKEIAYERTRLESIVDAIHCGTWEWDTSSDQFILDERWAEIIGYRLDEMAPITSKTPLKLAHPDDAPMITARLRAHLCGETERFHTESRARHKDGHWVWVEDSGRVTERDALGAPLKFMGARQDISARKQAQEDLRRESERFIALAKVSDTGVWEWDAKAQYLWCSHEYFSMLGLSPANFDLTGKPNLENTWATLLHPGDKDQATEAFARYLAGEKTSLYENTFRMRNAQGGWVWILSKGRTLRDANGRFTDKTLGTHINITSLIEAQQSLEENQERLKRISDNLPDCALYQIDCGKHGETRHFRYLSEGIERIHQVSVKDVLADSSILYKQALPEYQQIVADKEALCIQQMKEFRIEISSIMPDGSQRWFMVISSPKRLSDGHIIFDGIEIDITERKRQEQQIRELNATLELRVEKRTTELQNALTTLQRTQNELIQNEKLASLGALVAGIAHELNTPIGNAVMLASALNQNQNNFRQKIESGLTRTALSEFVSEVAESSAIIERNLERAAELIRSFKQLAVDQTSYQRREFSLKGLTHEIALALHPSLRKTTIQLIDQVPEDLHLDSFPGPLGQVLINLINNALVHAFEGKAPNGRSDEGGASNRISLNAELIRSGWMRLNVSDNGIGISPENMRKIFDPFFTTKLGHGGSGLGLHITYNLVTGILGGKVEVQSDVGKGSCFILDLPLVAPALEQKPE